MSMRPRKKILPVLVIAVALAGMFLATVFWTRQSLVVKLLAARLPEVLFFVTTDLPVLALTIDDAPDPELTPRILEVLARHEIQVTFFLLGSHALGNEALLARMRGDGHELANHHWRDEPSIQLADSAFVAGLLRTEALVKQPGPIKWFRPGSGWFNDGMLDTLAAHGFRCCLGAIYPYDNVIRQPEVIVEDVLAGVFPGAVIILHGGGPERDYVVEVLDTVIPELKRRGYRFLTVSKLWELRDRPPATPWPLEPGLE